MATGVISHVMNGGAAHGLAEALPPGVIKTPAPFITHDYTLTDPMNIKAADDLLYNIVINKREAMAPEGKLYVIMGEEHETVSHLMLQAGLVENCAATYREKALSPVYRPLFAWEQPYNKLVNYLRTPYGLSLDDKAGLRLCQRDHLGHVFARAVLANNTYCYAPQSTNRLFDVLLRTKTPLTMIDAGRKRNKWLSENDPVSNKIIKQRYTKVDLVDNPVNVEETAIDKPGMQIRNAVMAVRTKQAAHYHKAGIIIAGTGLAHLGDKRYGLLFDTSFPGELQAMIRPQDEIIILSHEMIHIKNMPEMDMPPVRCRQVTPVILRNLSEDWVYVGRKKDKEEKARQENNIIDRLGSAYGAAVERPKRFTESPQPDKEDVRNLLSKMKQKRRPLPH